MGGCGELRQGGLRETSRTGTMRKAPRISRLTASAAHRGWRVNSAAGSMAVSTASRGSKGVAAWRPTAASVTAAARRVGVDPAGVPRAPFPRSLPMAKAVRRVGDNSSSGWPDLGAFLGTDPARSPRRTWTKPLRGRCVVQVGRAPRIWAKANRPMGFRNAARRTCTCRSGICTWRSRAIVRRRRHACSQPSLTAQSPAGRAGMAPAVH
jgi:hypothetical protein